MSFRGAIQRAYAAIKDRSSIVQPTRWQSMDVSKVKAATTHEVLNYTLQAQVPTEDLDQLRIEIEPNLPWADAHFEERVGGKPLNPGVEWAHWPWANKADEFRHEHVPGQSEKGFSHTYMERMWPRWANVHSDNQGDSLTALRGVRYKYGDAMSVVQHLAKAPDSRQAYLPIWFPEDTGKLEVRVPCTLGYHFIQRHGYLHCTYYIRSCDLYRHFRDDIYLTVRLQLWMLNQLRRMDDPTAYTDWQKSQVDKRESDREPWRNPWLDVKPGIFTMHVVSLHCFVNDYNLLFRSSQR